MTTIGSNVEWFKGGPKPKIVRGKVTGIRRSSGIIKDTKTGEQWPGVQFRIKPEDGSRAVWTDAFPDKAGEFSHLRPGVVQTEPVVGGGDDNSEQPGKMSSPVEVNEDG
jgi:hypothetical protein